MKHKHAELMMQYAQDAMETDKPWERWEYQFDGSTLWHPFDEHSPAWANSMRYRRKPRTITCLKFPSLYEQILK